MLYAFLIHLGFWFCIISVSKTWKSSWNVPAKMKIQLCQCHISNLYMVKVEQTVKIIYFKYGIVIFFSMEGFLATRASHSSRSIFPSPLKSASSNVYWNRQMRFILELWYHCLLLFIWQAWGSPCRLLFGWCHLKGVNQTRLGKPKSSL